MGNYWNLMANNILGTEIFGQNSALETGMLRYFQQHGGLCMGLVRSHPWPAFWTGTANMNPLYGWPYVRTLLRRDEPDRALVSFYGMLAAGLTPEHLHLRRRLARSNLIGRMGPAVLSFHRTAPHGNAFWLHTLRTLLVQDWDLDDNGQPETLRLLFATPKPWLADGKIIKVENAPTAFGPVSLGVESRLSQGEVLAEVMLPQRNAAQHTLLRIRLPDGWKVNAANSGTAKLPVDDKGTVDLSALSGK